MAQLEQEPPLTPPPATLGSTDFLPTRKASNGFLKPCYLVVQPTHWCVDFQHIIRYRLAWRQCDYHSNKKIQNPYALCPPDERDKKIYILAYEHLYASDEYGGPRELPSTPQHCKTCKVMWQHTTHMVNVNEWYELRKRYDDNMYKWTFEEGQELVRQCEAQAAAMRPGLVHFHEMNRRTMLEAARALYDSNPQLRIFTGLVTHPELDERPQHFHEHGTRDFDMVEHKTKKMNDDTSDEYKSESR